MNEKSKKILRFLQIHLRFLYAPLQRCFEGYRDRCSTLNTASLGLTFFLLLLPLGLSGQEINPIPRFFYSGDGTLFLQGQRLSYRNAEGTYSETGLKQIHQLFQAPWNPPEERLNLRFIEILDYVQDHLGGGSYTLKSGYRSPKLNQSLRSRGKLAAQSSMHIEGAAGDLSLQGVPAQQVFEFVKALNCCGIGWYHSRHFHLDTGPARYWDETTSKTEDRSPQQNEKIILQTQWDRYLPGESLNAQFMRVSEYPIGVASRWEWIPLKTPDASTPPKPLVSEVSFPSDVRVENQCAILQNRTQARQLRITPPQTTPGLYQLKISFCQRYGYEKMPTEILSTPFEILQKEK